MFARIGNVPFKNRQRPTNMNNLNVWICRHRPPNPVLLCEIQSAYSANDQRQYHQRAQMNLPESTFWPFNALAHTLSLAAFSAQVKGHGCGSRGRVYNRAVRFLTILVMALMGTLAAGEPLTYLLWDGSESVADYANRVNLPTTKTLDLGNDIKLDLVLIPAGKFVMGMPEYEQPAMGQTMVALSGGIMIVVSVVWLVRARKNRKRPQFSLAFMLMMTAVASIGVWGCVRWKEALKHPDLYPHEHPAHAVTLTKPFYMGKHPVTREQYQQVAGANPSKTSGGKDHPVDSVSWDEAQTFCIKLTTQTKENVRLPTEAEWEYSCRAGTTTAYYSGDTEADLARVAWYMRNSKNSTHPVGQKEPNAFGLYDMHGNVEQWCEDWWSWDYRRNANSETVDPTGAEYAHGPLRILRGGDWYSLPETCRSASRGYRTPEFGLWGDGFRIVVTAVRSP